MGLFKEFKRLSFRYKNNKFWYYLLNNIRQYLPSLFFQKKLQDKIGEIKEFDSKYIQQRVEYYNRLNTNNDLTINGMCLSEYKLGKKMKTYFFDSYEFIRFFNPKLRAIFLFGDITHIPEEPSFVKSRPIEGDITNSVILKLDKIRHFLFVNDYKSFQSKKNMMVGRNKAAQAHRIKFLEMYFNHPMCNIGQVNKSPNPQFIANRITISEHLKYKFILCLEGWDVASNLKWVMSSNSLAVMTKPKYETWFMEGTLIPNHHYMLIKDDYTDLEERMNYYIEHTDEALQIIRNAHEYVDQFRNVKREDLISLLVLKKYFEKTCQKVI